MNQETSERVRIFAARTILTMNPAQPQATHVAVRDSTVPVSYTHLRAHET